jgi:hypothetical protein
MFFYEFEPQLFPMGDLFKSGRAVGFRCFCSILQFLWESLKTQKLPDLGFNTPNYSSRSTIPLRYIS